MAGLTRAQVAEISAAIIARGWNLDSLSEASGVRPDALLMIMRGELRPVPEIRQRLAGALGIDPREIQ